MSPEPSSPAPVAAGSPEVETTLRLIERAQQGDAEALDRLVARYLPRLRRWASGRLPPWARDLAETQDLVQDTLIRAFKGIERFEARGEGALAAYLRQVLLNRIREEIRRSGRRPVGEALVDEHAAPGASPLEQVIGRQGVERYEAALARLRPRDREAIVLRLELGCGYDEVATATGSPNANAARSLVVRALRQLLDEMRHGRAG